MVATLNQIAGFASTDNAHAVPVGVPAIMGMNFQAPNIAQKFSGYVVGASWPTPAQVTTLGPLAGNRPGLADAFDYVDGALRRMLDALDAEGLTDSTLIIVTSKHGNSPVDPAELRPIDPATTLVPEINSVQAGLAAQVTDDTNALIWLKDHSRAGEVADVLRRNAAVNGAESIYSGPEIDRFLMVSLPATRHGAPISSSSRFRGWCMPPRAASSPTTVDSTIRICMYRSWWCIRIAARGRWTRRCRCDKSRRRSCRHCT